MEGPIGRAVWMLAWPTMLQNAIGGIQGLIDHAMVGHFVGYAGNAAIGVSWQIFLVVYVFMASLFTGMGVLVARFVGKNEPAIVTRVVVQAFLTAAFLALCVLAPLGYVLAPSLLDLVHASAEVRAEALPYIRTMFLFGFGVMVFFMMGGALRAAGDARTPLRLGIWMTVLNVALNVVLIPGLGPVPAFGTLGAALGYRDLRGRDVSCGSVGDAAGSLGHLASLGADAETGHRRDPPTLPVWPSDGGSGGRDECGRCDPAALRGLTRERRGGAGRVRRRLRAAFFPGDVDLGGTHGRHGGDGGARIWGRGSRSGRLPARASHPVSGWRWPWRSAWSS